jgi:redox-sensitive bicupin YhaK (pirin superfamily)
VQARLIIGAALGMVSPIRAYSSMFYLDVLMRAGSRLARPLPGQECALYVIRGDVEVAGEHLTAGDFALVEDAAELVAKSNARAVLLGGPRWETVPLLEWNFVAYSQERMAQAKRDWQAGAFPRIPGDDAEHIPLPD